MTEKSEDQDPRCPPKKIVWAKLATFLVLSGILLGLQFLVGSWKVSPVWGHVLIVAFAYAIVMVTDATCELFDRRGVPWDNWVLGFLLPVEPRGISQAFALVGLIAAVAIAIEIQGCQAPPKENGQDAEVQEPAESAR